jgi:hypothetical protein
MITICEQTFLLQGRRAPLLHPSLYTTHTRPMLAQRLYKVTPAKAVIVLNQKACC